MPTSIRWFGFIALLGAAGVAVLVATATAQSLPVAVSTLERDLTAAERTQLATLVQPCWSPGTLADVKSVVIKRGKGADVNKIFQVVDGVRQLTRAEAFAKLQGGETVGANRMGKELKQCEIALPNATLTSFANAVWTRGPLTTLREIAVWRGEQPQSLRVFALGAVTMTSDQVGDELDAGRDVIPLGVFE